LLFNFRLFFAGNHVLRKSSDSSIQATPPLSANSSMRTVKPALRTTSPRFINTNRHDSPEKSKPCSSAVRNNYAPRKISNGHDTSKVAPVNGATQKGKTNGVPFVADVHNETSRRLANTSAIRIIPTADTNSVVNGHCLASSALRNKSNVVASPRKLASPVPGASSIGCAINPSQDTESVCNGASLKKIVSPRPPPLEEDALKLQPTLNTQEIISIPASQPPHLPKPSILKKKSVDEPSDSSSTSKPVSILKRKTLSQDGAVTFSPSVVEREQNKKKQGILKKRRSLDENEVCRRRSFSPDKSILKNARRSSMEELTSILKRDSSETLHEPQGILKRKVSTPPIQSHVTIADAVIMAAARALGEEQPLLDSVRPILKKKGSSEDHTPELVPFENPRPILKKKSGEVEDVPMVKPILKTSRKSSEEELPSAPILKKSDVVECEANGLVRRARSVSTNEHDRAQSAPPNRGQIRPRSLAESGTDFHSFLQNELHWSPPLS